MNWVDAVFAGLILTSVIIGSKKGLVREIMAFLLFFTAVITTMNFIDDFAGWVYSKIGGSPLITAFLSFTLLLAASYAVFKLAGMAFYQVANLKSIGKKDQMGGALVGFLRGWLAVGALTFLVFLLPMPEKFYTAFEGSFFGPAIAKTLPLAFEGTAKMHPANPDFMVQMEKTLIEAPRQTTDVKMKEEDRQEVFRVLYQMERFFKTVDANKT